MSVVSDLIAEYGDTPTNRIFAGRIAGLVAQAEGIEANIAAGGVVDPAVLANTSSTILRLMDRLRADAK
jgi:hypothetical protein